MKRKINPQDMAILVALALVIGLIAQFIYSTLIISLLASVGSLIVFFLYRYFSKVLKDGARIKKIEEVFPDFVQLMASNLRAGMTVNRAMLLSAREEFAPLDKEILRVGKDITTGRDLEVSLIDMADRIGSVKIRKTINIIISGLRAGGNLALILEDISSNIRERDYVEKKAASNVSMYVIFIFIAVTVASPVLFGLSNVLVEVMKTVLGGISVPESSTASMPITFSKIALPIDFLFYFSILFMLVTNLLTSLVLGIIKSGQEKEGLKYFLPISAVGISIFFVVKMVVSQILATIIG